MVYKKRKVAIQMGHHKISLIIISIILLSSYAYAEGVVKYNGAYANMTVYPATVFNPHLQWQRFDVSAKNQAGGLCGAFVFNHSLEWSKVRFLSGNGKWINVKDKFDYIQQGNKHIYYIKTPLHFDTWSNHSWAIKYKPSYTSGKWDLYLWDSPTNDCKQDYQDTNYNFLYVLDPWWTTSEQNRTEGFTYMTNNTFADRFEDYNYTHVLSAESTSGWTDAPACSMGTSTERIEGALSYNATGTQSSCWHAVYGPLGPDWLNYTISNYDMFRVWTKSNGTEKHSIQVHYNDSTYDELNVSHTDWNYTDIDMSNKAGKQLTYFLFKPNIENNNDANLLVDHLYIYNPTNRFNRTNRWDYSGALNPVEYQLSNNGYGFNSTWLATYDNLVDLDNVSYDNYEIILKAKILQDLGGEYCRLGFTDATHNVLGFRNSNWYLRDGDANTYTPASPSIAAGTVNYLRFVRNHSLISMYGSNTFGHNWTLLLNYTENNDYPTNNRIYLRGLNAHCVFDQVLIRELLPTYVPLGDYTISFIYDSSNETKWNRSGYKLWKDGVKYTNWTWFYNPTDWDNIGFFTLTESGEYYGEGRVGDIYGNEAWNQTQNISVNMFGFYNCNDKFNETLNMTIYDEDNPSNELVADVEIEGTTWVIGQPLSNKSFNFSFSGASNYRICITPDQAIQADVYIKYTTTNGFTHRYYIINDTFTTTPTYISMYNLNTTTGISDLSLTIRNKNTYSYMPNIIGKLQRHYVGEGLWRTVQMDESGNFGNIFYNVHEENTDYKITFTDRNNNVLDTTESMKFICTDAECELTYLLTPYSSAVAAYNVTLVWTYNNATKMINVSWTDPLGDNVNIRSQVTKEGTQTTTTICDDNATAVSGYHECNVSLYDGLLFLRVSSSKSPYDPWIAVWIDVFVSPLASLVDWKEGVFWTFGIALTTMFVGIFSPVGSIIALIFGLVIAYALNLTPVITFPFLILVAIIGIAIGVKIKE